MNRETRANHIFQSFPKLIHLVCTHKTGTGPDWRGASVGINDVGLLTAPDGRTFTVAVMIRQTKQGAEARHRLMRNVAHAVEAYWQAGDPTPGGSAPVFAGEP